MKGQYVQVNWDESHYLNNLREGDIVLVLDLKLQQRARKKKRIHDIYRVKFLTADGKVVRRNWRRGSIERYITRLSDLGDDDASR